MGVNLFIVAGALGLPTACLVLCLVRDQMVVAAAAVMGALIGATAGAGLLIGAGHQPTTANIHSGYSFASVGEWFVLAALGGAVGAVVGAVLGALAARTRLTAWLLVGLALAGAIGWVVDGTREVIDCDDRAAFCEDRYG